MEKIKRLRVSEVNPHLICVLCGGYYIDATTIVECLHTFCKTCIVAYLEASRHCPVCDNLVHKTKPHLRLRLDHALQDLVYKLVPGLFQGANPRSYWTSGGQRRETTIDEMKKRRKFYKDDIQSGRVCENDFPEERERTIFSADELISVILELNSNGTAPKTRSVGSKKARLEAADRRYLLCPGRFTIRNLKMFIRMKFNLCDRYRLDVYHTEEILREHLTLIDVAYIYSWRRDGPLRLYYSVYTNLSKRVQTEVEKNVHKELNEDIKNESSGCFTHEETLVNKHDTNVDIMDEHDNSKNDSGIWMDEVDLAKEQDIKRTNKNDAENHFTNTNATGDSSKVINGEKEYNDIEDKQLFINKNIERKKHGEETEDLVNENAIDLRTNSFNSLKDKSEESVMDYIPLQCVNNKERCKEYSICSSKESFEQVLKESRNEDIYSNITMEVSTALTQKKYNCSFKTQKISKSCITDEDISEPVVSSTQNTQGCQTESPNDSSMESLKMPHSSDIKRLDTLLPTDKSTVDVSCETDNFTLSRQKSKDYVSVSTETELESKIEFSTDAYFFTKSEQELDNKKTVDCGTDSAEKSSEIHKRSLLSMDCTVHDIPNSSNKRKYLDKIICNDESEIIIKTDFKVPKPSVSYNGHTASPKSAYLAHPLSPTKLKLKFRAPNVFENMSSKSSVASTPRLKLPSSQSPPPSQYKSQSHLKFNSCAPNSHVPRSSSRAKPTGFQSQYQSFVMELPEKIYRFEDGGKETIKPITISKSNLLNRTVRAQTGSRRTFAKSRRVRGRPPKHHPQDITTCPSKKTKSRSLSPKYGKESGKTFNANKETLVNIDGVRSKSAKTTVSDTSKLSFAYSLLNKIDTSSKHSERKSQKLKLKYSRKKSASDEKIPKQFVYFSNGQYTIASVSSLNTVKQSSPVSLPPKTVFTSEVYCSNKNIKNTNDINHNTNKTCSSDKHMNHEGDELKDSAAGEMNVSENTPNIETIMDEKSDSYVSANIDLNQNRIVKPSASHTNLSNVVETDKQRTEASKCPEHRQQSPFLASVSETQSTAPHRPKTHLNIPDISSHFSSAHNLYFRQRFANARFGAPMYPPFSLNDSSTVSSAASTFEGAKKIETLTLPCTTYLPTHPASYLGLLHSYLLSSLPSLPPSTHKRLYSGGSKSMILSDSSVHANNFPSSAKNTSAKLNVAHPKDKEKSLDRVISAIIEMRNKKETQEQANVIDLSTKGIRQNDAPNDFESGNKFEFTDDEDELSPSVSLNAKSDKESEKKQTCNMRCCKQN